MSAGILPSMLHPLILSNNKSRLRKDQNLCFVNSTLQVLYSIDDFRLFFLSVEAPFPASLPVCREIAKLFRSKGEYEVSASELRRTVGLTSRKSYLANGGQQDAEEFLRTLIEQLMVELPAGHYFLPSLQSFWGEEKNIRKFLDTPDGKCPRCMTYPGSSEEPFFTMKVKVLDYNCKFTLSSLVDRYYAENTDRVDMKCSNCCPHPSNCPLTGICRQRPAISQTVMTRSPKYLIVQLQ